MKSNKKDLKQIDPTNTQNTIKATFSIKKEIESESEEYDIQI